MNCAARARHIRCPGALVLAEPRSRNLGNPTVISTAYPFARSPRIVEFYPRDQMISWKALGVALLFVGLLGAIKLLFDLVERNRRP